MWYRIASEKHPWINYPLSKTIPEGAKRRIHYTSSDQNLDKIKEEGILVDKSESYKYGDPKAVWSNPASEQLIKSFSHKPLVEFYTDPEKIEGDQYSFYDVSPDQILGVYPSWHSKLIYLLENYGVEGSLKTLEDLGLKNSPEYEEVYYYLLKIDWLERHNVEMENGKFVFYHGSRANLEGNKLRKGSFLETSPEQASHWGNYNVRNDRRKKLKVYKVLVDINEINTGHWASLAKDMPVTEVKY